MVVDIIMIIALVTKVENNLHPNEPRKVEKSPHLNEPGVSSLLEAAAHARLDVDSSKSRDLTQHTRNLIMAELMVVVVMIRMVGMMLMVMGIVMMRMVKRMSVCNVLSSFLFMFRPGCNLQGEVQASFGLISVAGPRSIGTCLNTFAITNMSDYVFDHKYV